MKAPDKMQNKIDNMIELIQEISSELEYISYDYDDLDSNEQKQIPTVLKNIESHLRKTAPLFTHLTGNNKPDWGSK